MFADDPDLTSGTGSSACLEHIASSRANAVLEVRKAADEALVSNVCIALAASALVMLHLLWNNDATIACYAHHATSMFPGGKYECFDA